jgi:hypothetical protein
VRSGILAVHTISSTIAVLLLATGTVEAGDRVFEAPDAVEPLAPGSRVPPARVMTVRGEQIDLREQVRDRGALLVFYRGGW